MAGGERSLAERALLNMPLGYDNTASGLFILTEAFVSLLLPSPIWRTLSLQSCHQIETML